MLVAGCGSSGTFTASVDVTSDGPLSVRTSPVQYINDGDRWFRHDLTVENTGDRAVIIDVTAIGHIGRYFGKNRLLLTGSCGPSSEKDKDGLPTIACTADAAIPFRVEPHATHALTTWTVVKGVSGMSKLKPGTYTAETDLKWKYADTNEEQITHIKATYDVKQ